MRLGLVTLACSLLLACSSGSHGHGGAGGQSGIGGAGGGDSCAELGVDCHPSCDSDQIWDGTACVDAYTASVTTCPDSSGPKLKVQFEFRPANGQPPLVLSQLTVASVLGGLQLGDQMVALSLQDNLLAIDVDLSKYDKASGDQLPLEIHAHNIDSNKEVSCQVLVDNRAPQIDPDPAPRTPFRRDQPVLLTASVFDTNLAGGFMLASLTAPGAPPPPPPSVSQQGWFAGTQDASRSERWSFSIEQGQAPLPALDGTLVPYFWGQDRWGNGAMVRVDAPEKIPGVTRKAWTSAHPLPGVPLAPVVDAQDRVGVLVAGTTDNFAVYDGLTGKEDRYSMPGSTPPVVGASGDFYSVSLDHISSWRLDSGALAPVSNCLTAAYVTSPPTVLSTGTMELAAYSRIDGMLADLSVDGTCGAERVTTSLGATDVPPAAGVALSGRTVLVIGGQKPNTLSTFTLVQSGAFTRPLYYAPPGLETLGGVPLAIDGDTVLAAPRFRNQAMAFRFVSGFDQAPTPRSLTLENVANDGVGPPVVSAHAALFPTAKGLRALPRSTSWTQDAVFAPTEAFDAPPLAGKGDILYAVNRQGLLHVLQYSEAPDPALSELWSAQIGSGETFTVSPALTCHGLLVLVSDQGNVHTVVVDSLGLDDQAPWPKVLHDARNTASAGTALGCGP